MVATGVDPTSGPSMPLYNAKNPSFLTIPENPSNIFLCLLDICILTLIVSKGCPATVPDILDKELDIIETKKYFQEKSGTLTLFYVDMLFIIVII